MTSVNRREPENTISIVSNASGSWGYGAICGCNWFQLEWLGLGQAQQYNITTKELLPVVVAAALWGQSWRGQSVKALCDNSAVVAIVNSGSSRDPEAIHLKRSLAFVEFHLFCQHIHGRDNTAADALSRNRLTLFHDVYPQARKEPTDIPAAVLDQARLDLRGLDKSVDRLFQECLAPSTARTYVTVYGEIGHNAACVDVAKRSI